MKARVVIASAALALFSSLAAAGYLQPAPVIVELNGDGSGQAFGDMVTARFADNDVELIGCGIRVFDNGTSSFEFGFCQAADSTGVQGFCSTTNPNLLNALESISDFSFIIFSWNASGECVRIGNSTQSFYIPEFQGKGKKK
jgi:hypothetical protein